MALFKLPVGFSYGEKIDKEIERVLSQDPRFLKGEKLKEYINVRKWLERQMKAKEKEDKDEEFFEKVFERIPTSEDSIMDEDIPLNEEKYYNSEEFQNKLKNVEKKKLMAYTKAKKEKEITDRKIKALKEKDVTEVIREARDKGRISQITSLKQKWMNLFNMKSYYNDLAGEMLFHVLLGQLFKNKFFYKGSKRMNLKCNFFWIQDSGSGKGESVDVLCDVVREINKILSKKNNEVFNFAEFKGEETDAVVLTRFAYRKDDMRKGYDYSKTIPGKFERYDFYIYREAKTLIKGGQYTNKMADYFLHILEDQIIEKELEKWSGQKTKTYGRGSLIATTIPVSSLPIFIANTGLLQRCLGFMRLLEDNIRKKMSEKDAITLGMNINERHIYKTKYNKLVKEIAKELVKLREEFFDVEIDIKEPDKINSVIMKEMSKINRRIDVELQNFEHQQIARSFMGRYPMYIMKLMYQNAIIRKSHYIEIEDVINAIDIIWRSYKYMETWLQDVIMVDQRRKYNEDRIIRTLTQKIIKSQEGVILYKDARNALVYGGNNRMSMDRARYVIRRFSSTPRSPFVRLIKDKERYIGLRGERHDGYQEV